MHVYSIHVHETIYMNCCFISAYDVYTITYHLTIQCASSITTATRLCTKDDDSSIFLPLDDSSKASGVAKICVYPSPAVCSESLVRSIGIAPAILESFLAWSCIRATSGLTTSTQGFGEQTFPVYNLHIQVASGKQATFRSQSAR